MQGKKHALIQLSILVVLGLAVVLTLVLPQFASTVAKPVLVEISLFLQSPDMALSSNTRLGMEAAAMDFGGELRFISSADDSHQTQLDNILREVEGGARALVVTPVDSQALEKSLSALAIPLVTTQSPLDCTSHFVSPDNGAVGKQLAQAVIEDSRKGDTILLLDTAQGQGGIALRAQACTQALEESGRTVLTATLQGAQELESVPTAVVALEDETTLQLASWQLSQGTDVPLYGVGGTAEIASYLERGVLRATVAWSDYAMGYLAVQSAICSAQNQPVPTPSIVITTIRGEHIYDSDIQKLLFPVV